MLNTETSIDNQQFFIEGLGEEEDKEKSEEKKEEEEEEEKKKKKKGILYFVFNY